MKNNKLYITLIALMVIIVISTIIGIIVIVTKISHTVVGDTQSVSNKEISEVKSIEERIEKTEKAMQNIDYKNDSAKYINNYKKASDIEKVEMNLNKIMKALKNEDYEYIYSKSSDKLKTIYKNKEDYFELLKKTNSYIENIRYDGITPKEGIYYANVVLKMGKVLVVWMDFKEGTDFVIEDFYMD